MDRLIAPNSVALAQADTAPTTGTPQYATDGNPATNVAATLWPAYAFNTLQDEVYNVIVGAGLTPDRTEWNQLLAAILKLVGQPQNNLVSGVVGQVRNLLMSVAAASATATLKADEIIVESALGGVRYCLPSFNEAINLGTTGAGGMDAGTAPASGYIALYAIFNPTTGAASLLATNATSAVQPSVYGGANMPAGYTASALVGVWPTNASKQFPIAFQVDREVFVASAASGTFTTALTNAAITLAVPPNAKTASLATQQTTTGASTSYQFAAAAASPVNGGLASMTQSINVSTASLTTLISNGRVALLTPQTTFVTWVEAGGTFPQLLIAVSSYTF
jgi:hypothetical protein